MSKKKDETSREIQLVESEKNAVLGNFMKITIAQEINGLLRIHFILKINTDTSKSNSE